MSLIDSCARFLRCVRRELGAGAFAQHAAGGEQLDDGRTDGDLLARRRAHRVRSVGDPADLHPVPAGDRDPTGRGDDAWAFQRAALDLARELDDHRPSRAEVAHGGDTAAQREARVAESLQRRRGLALPRLGLEVGAAVESQMAVAVDETGQRESATSLQRSRSLTFRGLGYA